jgi:hypothetical protein
MRYLAERCVGIAADLCQAVSVGVPSETVINSTAANISPHVLALLHDEKIDVEESVLEAITHITANAMLIQCLCGNAVLDECLEQIKNREHDA